MGSTSHAAAGRRFAALLLAPAALLLAACGPAPALGTGGARVAEAPPAAPVTIIVIEQAQPGGEAAAGVGPSAGAWVPEEAHGDNPFERARLWRGDYDCPQGTTELTFQIVGVDGDRVKAVFDFHHEGSGAQGKYLMVGRYDEETRTAMFSAGEWLEQPPNYVTVGMKGDVALDGSLFSGRIDHPLCGAFRLRPTNLP